MVRHFREEHLRPLQGVLSAFKGHTMLVQVGTAAFILATLSGSRGFILLSLAVVVGAFYVTG